ncbi:hypothetical protein G6038_29945 [Rhodococcus sp. 14C212]|uniref:hypothetical protein n=1 Tax=Rhodococcus sp. 14C212 TaxID=2711209 RepID=UPI0013EA7FB2|nr:hypothetical protein [Rhodococcus sp. 14C212]NGP09613.1 hypothetical protein [Rhodococcus sp. 14C212]
MAATVGRARPGRVSYARRAAPRDQREHLTTPASRADDESAQAIAGRIEHIHRISNAPSRTSWGDFAQRSASTAPATMLLAELDRVAADRRDLTNPDATEWTATPVSDTETRRGPRRGHRGGDDPDQQPRRAGRRGDEYRAQ